MMFSVIMPVYNKLPHLDRAVNSILRQSFEEFELLIIDDGSTDGSYEKIESYNDRRIRTYRRNNPGPGGYAARNLGIDNSRYDWLAFLDADDEWNCNFLSFVSTAIKTGGNVELVSTGWVKCNSESNHLGAYRDDFKAELSEFSLVEYLEQPKFIWTGAVVVKKNITVISGGFPTDKTCKRGGDVDTWIRWLMKSKKNIYINESLSYYYRDTVNQVTDKPNIYFCAYNTLKQIYIEERDPKLRRAIRKFSNFFLYNMLVRQIRAGLRIDYSQVGKMYLTAYAVLRVSKLHFIRLKYLGKRI